MNIARLLGHASLWLGFLGATFATVNTTEISRTWYKTIATPNYLLPFMVGIAGVLILRTTSKRRSSLDLDDEEGQLLPLKNSLNQICEILQTWQKGKPLEPSSICSSIDEQLMGPLGQFADDRHALIEAYGLPAYASIMTEFATGERFVNRAWSAGADGYFSESYDSLARASRHFQRAMERISEQENEGLSSTPSATNGG